MAYRLVMGGAGKADNASRGILLMVMATMVFSLQDALTKHLVQTYAVEQILWLRYMFFTVFALYLSARTRPLRHVLRAQRPFFQIVRSVVILVAQGCFAYAVRVLPLADAHSLIACAPLFATALSAFLLAEKVGVNRWVAVAAGFLGVMVILRPGLTVLQPASVIVLTAASCFAVYNIMTRAASRSDDGETMLLYMAWVGAVLLTAVGPFFWTPPSLLDLGLMLVLGFAGTVGHFFLIKALEAAPASLLQPFNYLMLVWAIVNGFIIFGDFPDHWTLAGAAIVAASGLYVIRREGGK